MFFFGVARVENVVIVALELNNGTPHGVRECERKCMQDNSHPPTLAEQARLAGFCLILCDSTLRLLAQLHCQDFVYLICITVRASVSSRIAACSDPFCHTDPAPLEGTTPPQSHVWARRKQLLVKIDALTGRPLQ